MTEKQKKKILKKNKKMQNLVMFRGTKEEIVKKLHKIGNREDIPVLQETEEKVKNQDLCFNTNIGEIDTHFLDYEIYMLPTNKKDNFIITEVVPF